MEDKIRKFPNGGYDVRIVSKEDILETINNNIIDKEIATELISTLEINIKDFIKKERWTGIPYLGTVKVPEHKILKKDQKDIIKEAYESMPKDEYVMFCIHLTSENKDAVRRTKLYRHLCSMAVNKDIKLFRKVSKENGSVYGRLFMYFRYMFKSINNEFVITEEDE